MIGDPAGAASAGEAGAASPISTLRSGIARLSATFLAERERWPLWAPVAIGLGIGVYFALPVEPQWWIGPVVATLGVVVIPLSRRSAAGLWLAVAAAFGGLGFGVVAWRANDLAAPVLERRVGPVSVEGEIVAIEIRAEGRRVLLESLRIVGITDAATPHRARISARSGLKLRPGDRIKLRAVLQPPPAPAAPGAFDFQRHAWFARLGAVGYAVGAPTVMRSSDAATPSWRQWINAKRQAVVELVLETIPGPAGAIVAALLTGEMGAIPQDVLQAMRDSGLAHLLSISGLHIGLVAGAVFLAVRQALAMIPRVALRWPIKKWAAVAALLAIAFYAFFTTPNVPTQRAWLMTSIVLVAVLADRTAISLRLVAWAALAILLVVPEALLGPSLQMSFAAVVALVAAWEGLKEPLARWRADSGALRRGLLALAGVGMTTLVAGFASAPYALYHFNRFAAFGLVANLIAVPLTSVVVMPLAVLAFLLMPLGLAWIALIPMGWAVEAIIAVARWVAGWEGAVSLLPAMPTWGLVAISLGGLWLCLWRERWRLFGLPAIALGLASIALAKSPDLLVSADGRLFAVRGEDGRLHLSRARAGGMIRETWLRRAGQENADPFPAPGANPELGLACDAVGCVYRAKGHVVAMPRHVAALAEDCTLASVVVASIPAGRACRGPVLVIDRISLWRDGGHAVWLSQSGLAWAQSVRGWRGERPWVLAAPRPHGRARANETGGADHRPPPSETGEE